MPWPIRVLGVVSPANRVARTALSGGDLCLVADIIRGTQIDAVVEAPHGLVDDVYWGLLEAPRADLAKLVKTGASSIVDGVVGRWTVAVERLRWANNLGGSGECWRLLGGWRGSR